MCHRWGMPRTWASEFHLCLHLIFRTRREQKEKNSRRAITRTRLVFLRSGSLNKKTGFDTLWHDCFYIDFLLMTSLHEKNVVYTPRGQVVEVKNKGFKNAGISQVSQGMDSLKTLFSITAAAEHKLGWSICPRPIKREHFRSDRG